MMIPLPSTREALTLAADVLAGAGETLPRRAAACALIALTECGELCEQMDADAAAERMTAEEAIAEAADEPMSRSLSPLEVELLCRLKAVLASPLDRAKAAAALALVERIEA